MSKEYPILFAGPLVRAILEGRKTQTRRLVKLPASERRVKRIVPSDGAPSLWDAEGDDGFGLVWHSIACPYGVPGDRLWVRESWRTAASLDGYNATQIAERCEAAGYETPWAPLLYSADGKTVNWNEADWGEPGRQRMGRFMPRWASRLTLDVTEVRVQRLQEISDDDARAEGFQIEKRPALINGEPGEVMAFEPRIWFAQGWDGINGKRAAWASNPWVWCLTFRVLPEVPRG